MDTLYAEKVNYWKTSQSSPDTWMERAKKQVVNLGGEILVEGYGSEPQSGRAAYMLGFEIQGYRFKIVWPLLPSKTKNGKAAKVQAATMLYHDVKARCVSSVVLGVRNAFFAYLVLPNGQAAAEASALELMELTPRLLASHTI